ncbi:hypothetical protein P0D73_38705, partial [Paraburkholderia sp. RL18-101-BIB-B]|uniref:hypothetical protein n=1 Tax=Paraburkholderia sp. RL18-101-BIB-B TaxID=3031634 RepID=UPI0038B9B523
THFWQRNGSTVGRKSFNPDCSITCGWRTELLLSSSEHAMTNHPKEQARGVSRKDDQDKLADDIADSDRDSATPDNAAPILQSEDNEQHDEMRDEDAPE